MHKAYRAQWLWKKFRSGNWSSYFEMKESTDELDCFFGLSTKEIVEEINKEARSNEKTKENTMNIHNNKTDANLYYYCDLFPKHLLDAVDDLQTLEEMIKDELDAERITIEDVATAEFYKVTPITVNIEVNHTVEITEG